MFGAALVRAATITQARKQQNQHAPNKMAIPRGRILTVLDVAARGGTIPVRSCQKPCQWKTQPGLTSRKGARQYACACVFAHAQTARPSTYTPATSTYMVFHQCAYACGARCARNPRKHSCTQASCTRKAALQNAFAHADAHHHLRGSAMCMSAMDEDSLH